MQVLRLVLHFPFTPFRFSVVLAQDDQSCWFRTKLHGHPKHKTKPVILSSTKAGHPERGRRSGRVEGPAFAFATQHNSRASHPERGRPSGRVEGPAFAFATQHNSRASHPERGRRSDRVEGPAFAFGTLRICEKSGFRLGGDIAGIRCGLPYFSRRCYGEPNCDRYFSWFPIALRRFE